MATLSFDVFKWRNGAFEKLTEYEIDREWHLSAHGSYKTITQGKIEVVNVNFITNKLEGIHICIEIN